VIPIEIVAATRLSQEAFWADAALGTSIRRMMPDPLIPNAAIAFENKTGLPAIYNSRILADDSDTILLFVHDDVWIEDFYLPHRLNEALREYDVIGVAGTRRRRPGQRSWIYIDDEMTRESRENMSGRVAHALHPFGGVSRFGDAPAECELLDGVFLAARRSVLRERGVLFDTRFDFHLYDADFCRTARNAKLRLGTWPICITHQSGGDFDNAAFTRMLEIYRAKWPD
jgi:GT2 family glycosyltransferase